METVDHILSKMREPSCFKWKIPVERVDADFREFADRLEAAIKREREAVGNAAKMRKALSDACYAMFNFLKTQNGGYEEMAKALDKAKAALSAPPRNCDLYTVGEALRKYGFPTKSKPWGEKEWLDFCEWYIAEAKGE
jgi:hypothetical protein